MNISMSGIDLLKNVEGSKNSVYLDSGGAPTIGIGHLLTKSEKSTGCIWIKGDQHKEGRFISFRGNSITDKEVDDILKQDLANVESTIAVAVKVSLTQHQYDALVSFVFNIGNSAFINSTLLKKLNAGSYEEVPNQMRKWIYDNNKVVKGLMNRREKEVKMWEGRWNATAS